MKIEEVITKIVNKVRKGTQPTSESELEIYKLCETMYNAGVVEGMSTKHPRKFDECTTGINSNN